jgi:gamma-glutamylcyclotransferase (GGCT)/AIG2-like uncharacterized protein YtfP
VIDPSEAEPEIQLLFEAAEPSGTPRLRAAGAISIHGLPAWARSLQAWFEDRVRTLRLLDPDGIRDLARKYVYFAYGSNMSWSQMRERCPGAERLGKAMLYGWTRRFSVDAPHMGNYAVAAGIERSGNDQDHVEGVAWEIVPTELEQLDAIETGGYERTEVGIKLNGKHTIAAVHVPLRPIAMEDATNLHPTHEYLRCMMEGARQNGLNELAQQLQGMLPD